MSRAQRRQARARGLSLSLGMSLTGGLGGLRGVVGAVSNVLFGPASFDVGYTQTDPSGTGFPFLNRFKCSTWTDSTGDSTIPVINADLYPTAIPGTGLKCMINVEGTYGPASVTQRYAIETNLTDLVFNVSGPSISISSVTTTFPTGLKRYEFTVDTALLDIGYRIEMPVTSMPTPFVAGTHFMQMFRLDEEAAFKAGGMFTQQFLNRFTNLVDVIRFMDWVSANKPYVTQWSQRPKLSWSTWNENRGVPFEVMIALCNQTSRHMHVNLPAQLGVTSIVSTTPGPIGNMPTQVTDDISIANTYVDNLAALLNSTLNSNLLCGIEFTNEPWNFQFQQYYYLRSFQPLLAPAAGDYVNSLQMYGYRGAALMGRFMKAVGYNARFMPLWCAKAVDTSVSDQNLVGINLKLAEWANVSSPNYDAALAARYQEAGQLYKGYGIAPYTNGSFETTLSAPDKALVKTWAQDATSQGMLNVIRQLDTGDLLAAGNVQSLAGYSARFGAQFAYAQARQIPIFDYENNFEIPGAAGLDMGNAPDNVLVQDLFTRTYANSNFRALMLKGMKAERALGIMCNTILADAGNVGDKYATLTSAYGAYTPRGLGMQDFKAAPGSGLTLSVSIAARGVATVGLTTSKRVTTTGGIGRVRVTVTGLPPGRTFDGFRTENGAYTAQGSYTVTYTAADDTGATATASQTFTVGAAFVGYSQYRITPTLNTGGIAPGGGSYEFGTSEITLYNGGSALSNTGWTASLLDGVVLPQPIYAVSRTVDGLLTSDYYFYNNSPNSGRFVVSTNAGNVISDKIRIYQSVVNFSSTFKRGTVEGWNGSAWTLIGDFTAADMTFTAGTGSTGYVEGTLLQI